MFLQQIFAEIYTSGAGNHQQDVVRTNSSTSNKQLQESNQQSSVGILNFRLNSHCLLSEEARLQRKINQKIEQELRKEKRLARRNLKLLLLGTGESGKSTFIRQMRIIYENGYETIAERCEYIGQIHQNILITVLTIDHAMELLQISYVDRTLRSKLQQTLSLSYNHDYVQQWRQWFDSEFDGHHHGVQSLQSYQLIVQMMVNRLPYDYLDLLCKFWNDSGVQRCLQKRNEYNLMDSSTYFMNRLGAILQKSYVPSVQDILHVRIPTNGINEYNFGIDSLNFMLVDVGGQRTERRKWIHCFESVTSIIYIVALSEFDQILSTEPWYAWRGHFENIFIERSLNQQTVNKLDESKALFKMIITSRWFHDSSVVLFLNKFDLFEEKIFNNPNRLQDFFPEYSGMEPIVIDNDGVINQVDSAANYILRMFFEQDPDQFRKRVLYSHFTCATDTGNIKIVFQAVKDTIMEQMLCKEVQIF